MPWHVVELESRPQLQRTAVEPFPPAARYHLDILYSVFQITCLQKERHTIAPLHSLSTLLLPTTCLLEERTSHKSTANQDCTFLLPTYPVIIRKVVEGTEFCGVYCLHFVLYHSELLPNLNALVGGVIINCFFRCDNSSCIANLTFILCPFLLPSPSSLFFPSPLPYLAINRVQFNFLKIGCI